MMRNLGNMLARLAKTYRHGAADDTGTNARLDQPRNSPADRDRSIEIANTIVTEIYNNRLELAPAVIAVLKNIHIVAQIEAGMSAARWISKYATDQIMVNRRSELLPIISQQMPNWGELAEFGVFTGAVTRVMCQAFPSRRYHAFDSFRGLPETMPLAAGKGSFDLSGKIPDLPANAIVHAGWFDETVPQFAKEGPDSLAFVYIDCNLYSSVRIVLEGIRRMIRPGTMLVFDDWYNFPNWPEHSPKAFGEFLRQTGMSFELFGFTVAEHSAAFKCTAISGGRYDDQRHLPFCL